MVGDWMGSSYGLGGQRWDMCLFLDHDGRYERTERSEPSYERKEGGRWEYDEAERLLRLIPDTPADESGRSSDRWWVMSIESFESNLVLVLRAAMLASRNLPIMLYRVHGNDRAYGTGWQKRLA